ncbi:MAG: FRG domain-containing protein [Proteobacteria bacterium]|nr:FRG domain-containing protein [Pseudomonadota bacterium]
MTSAGDALEWMRRKADDQGDRILFRGQNRIWPTVKPSITRLDEQTMMEMWAICRWFHTAAHGVAGYQIPNEHDRLAILQHYIGRSPVIDLTGTPEVALYFALQQAEPNRECVVYSVDRGIAASSGVVFSDHSFLALPLDSGALMHRWLRQDGYSVGPAAWRDLGVVRNFDLLKLPGVESKCFTTNSADNNFIFRLGDLEDTQSDPLALAVRGVVTAVARSLELLTPGIINVLQASKTIDPIAKVVAEIDSLISLALTVKTPSSLLNELRRLRTAIETSWDTSCECSLDMAQGEIKRLVAMNDVATQRPGRQK